MQVCVRRCSVDLRAESLRRSVKCFFPTLFRRVAAQWIVEAVKLFKRADSFKSFRINNVDRVPFSRAVKIRPSVETKGSLCVYRPHPDLYQRKMLYDRSVEALSSSHKATPGYQLPSRRGSRYAWRLFASVVHLYLPPCRCSGNGELQTPHFIWHAPRPLPHRSAGMLRYFNY